MKSKKGVAATVIYRVIFTGIFLTSLLCALHPRLRVYLRGLFRQQFREILSTAKGPLLANFTLSHVIKVRTNEGIFVEIYGGRAAGTRPLLDRIQLPDQRDGYFSFAGKTSNLFVHDMDGDQIPEIIAPSFDENLVAHLNVFSFNQETLKLEPKRPPINQ